MGRSQASHVTLQIPCRLTGTSGTALENTMNFHNFRLASYGAGLAALILFVAISLNSGAALAQAPAATPSPALTASPAPAPSPIPEPAASPSPTPSPAPGAAQQAPNSTAPVQAADPFGEPITLEPKKVVIHRGNANWDNAFDTLVDSFKALTALLDKQGIKPS